MLDRLCVIGVGLIGGSIARAVRKQGLCSSIIGVGQNQRNLAIAKELGVIDEYSQSVDKAAESADMVIIATPVGSLESIVRSLYDSWSSDAVYTDVGSTKLSVVDAVKTVFGEVPPNFVPGHPIAGAEKSGVEASLVDLFQDKTVILTPLLTTSEKSLTTVRSLWTSIGAKVSEMDPAHHDSILAATSHFPHILAYALVDLLGKKDEKAEIFKYAAGGFKDFTRIASSDPKMWLDICLANKAEIIPLIEQFSAELDVIAAMLNNNASEALFDRFCGAKQARQRFIDRFNQ